MTLYVSDLTLHWAIIIFTYNLGALGVNSKSTMGVFSQEYFEPWGAFMVNGWGPCIVLRKWRLVDLHGTRCRHISMAVSVWQYSPLTIFQSMAFLQCLKHAKTAV